MKCPTEGCNAAMVEIERVGVEVPMRAFVCADWIRMRGRHVPDGDGHEIRVRISVVRRCTVEAPPPKVDK